jgi:hypothetical protein
MLRKPNRKLPRDLRGFKDPKAARSLRSIEPEERRARFRDEGVVSEAHPKPPQTPQYVPPPPQPDLVAPPSNVMAPEDVPPLPPLIELEEDVLEVRDPLADAPPPIPTPWPVRPTPVSLEAQEARDAYETSSLPMDLPPLQDKKRRGQRTSFDDLRPRPITVSEGGKRSRSTLFALVVILVSMAVFFMTRGAINEKPKPATYRQPPRPPVRRQIPVQRPAQHATPKFTPEQEAAFKEAAASIGLARTLSKGLRVDDVADHLKALPHSVEGTASDSQGRIVRTYELPGGVSVRCTFLNGQLSSWVTTGWGKRLHKASGP